MKAHVHTKTCTWMFISVLFVIDLQWKQSMGPSTDEQISKNVVYPYHGILLISRKEWIFDTCYSIDGSKIYHVKWQKPDWKGYILCGWIYVQFKKMLTNLYWLKEDHYLPGDGQMMAWKDFKVAWDFQGW